MQKPKGSITYTTIANHLASAVSDLLENKAKGRAIRGLKSGSSKIHDAEGEIKTGSYADWHDLMSEEKKIGGQERSCLGLKGPCRGANNNGRGCGGGCGSGGRGNGSPYSKQNSDLKAQNQKYCHQIKALKPKGTFNPDVDNNKTSDQLENNAGKHFGDK